MDQGDEYQGREIVLRLRELSGLQVHAGGVVYGSAAPVTAKEKGHSYVAFFAS